MLKEFAYATPQGFVRSVPPLLREESFVTEFIAQHKDDACYATFISYDIPDQDNATLTAPFVVDLDSENDIETARVETERLVELFREIGIEPYVYFSGAKGFHLVVPFELLGTEPDFHLVGIYKLLATEIKNARKLKTLDLKIYERKRLFRLNNTKNIKTGLYKIQITPDELRLPVAEIKKLAVAPRKTFLVKNTPSEKFKINFARVKADYFKSLERKSETQCIAPESIKLLPCVKKLLAGAEVGDRNNACYTLALFFKSQNVSQDDAKGILHGYSGLSDREVEQTVNSAFRNSYKFGCNENDLVQKHCDKAHCPFGFFRKTISDMVWDKDALAQELEKEKSGEFNTNLTFGLPEVDKAWGGIRKDEFIVCVADAGIGKSAYALWATRENTNKGNRVLFCSLEMSTHALLARTCRETGGDFEKMSEWIKTAPIYFYKDGERLSTKSLRRNLELGVKQGFGVDLVVIDHLGYIEKPSDQIYESVSQIAEELSSFCKDMNIPVMLLTHFNKGQAGASNKPRSINDLLGSGRLRDFASKVFQIWYAKDDEFSEKGDTSFIMHKNRYGNAPKMRLRYQNGSYEMFEKQSDIKKLFN